MSAVPNPAGNPDAASPLERFRRTLQDENMQEMSVFASIRNRLAASTVDTDAKLTEAAVIETYDVLAKTIPNGPQFGYQTARDARRWFRFRVAHANEHDQPAQGEQAAAMGGLLLAGNPLVVHSYARLEQRRLRTANQPDSRVTPPLLAEKIFIGRAVLSILDAGIATTIQPSDDPSTLQGFTKSIRLPDGPTTVNVARQKVLDEREYIAEITPNLHPDKTRKLILIEDNTGLVAVSKDTSSQFMAQLGVALAPAGHAFDSERVRPF